jgi:hypothetical protein
MNFYILSKYKIEAFENNLAEFIADDLVEAIRSGTSIVVSEDVLAKLGPCDKPYKYKVQISRA